MTTWSFDYLSDEAGRAYGALYDASDALSPRLVHLVSTDRGDVGELLDGAGSAFAVYRYDAWGSPTSLSSTSVPDSIGATEAAAIAARQVLRYAGYCYDDFSGLYYLSARYYDPATCQFISKDPVKADGEESAYQYCNSNPLQYTDPSGLRPNSKDAMGTLHAHGSISAWYGLKCWGADVTLTNTWLPYCRCHEYGSVGNSTTLKIVVTAAANGGAGFTFRITTWRVSTQDNATGSWRTVQGNKWQPTSRKATFVYTYPYEVKGYWYPVIKVEHYRDRAWKKLVRLAWPGW